jgi:hypothetical protein
MLRKIKVRTMPGSGRTSAGAAFPGSAAMSETLRRLSQHASVLRPVRREIRGTLTQAVAHRDQYSDQDQHHGHGPDRPRHVHALQQFHRGVEKIGQQNGQQQRDDHALRVVTEQQNDRRRDHPQAER